MDHGYAVEKIDSLTPSQIASICDHTFLNRSEAYKHVAKSGENPIKLRASAFSNFLEDTVELAKQGRIPYAACVRPEDVFDTKHYFSKSNYPNIKIASVIGFPDGSLYSTNFKLAETKLAIDSGADEIDMVLNYQLLKEGFGSYVEREVSSITEMCHDHDVKLKLIFETSELNDRGIRQACRISDNAGVDFIKTSTGFSSSGANYDDLKLMRDNFSGGIKMSGGVNPDNVKSFIEAISGRDDGYIELNPHMIRIGESSLLNKI